MYNLNKKLLVFGIQTKAVVVRTFLYTSVLKLYFLNNCEVKISFKTFFAVLRQTNKKFKSITNFPKKKCIVVLTVFYITIII